MTYQLTVRQNDATIYATPLLADTLRDAIDQAEAYTLLLEAEGFTLTDASGQEVVA